MSYISWSASIEAIFDVYSDPDNPKIQCFLLYEMT